MFGEAILIAVDNRGDTCRMCHGGLQGITLPLATCWHMQAHAGVEVIMCVCVCARA